MRGDDRRHHDDGTVAAVLPVARRPRHPRRLERRPQDLVHRQAHHVTVAVGADRIGEASHVGKQDRAVQRLAPALLPLCCLPLCCRHWAAVMGGRLLRGRKGLGPVRLPVGPGVPRSGIAQRGEPVQVDDGQAAGPLAARDDPAVPPRPQEPAHRVRARPGPVREFGLRHRQGEHRGLIAAPALGQVQQQPGQTPLRAGPLTREQPHPVLFPALGHLPFQHLGRTRVAAQELGEPFGGNHHRRDLVQRGHRGRPDSGGQRGPLPDHIPLAAHRQDLLGGPGSSRMLTLTQPESMIITWEVSSPAWHSTAPARKTSSTPAAASASRSGSASEFQKLRAVGRSQRTLAAATGISATCPAPGSAGRPGRIRRPVSRLARPLKLFRPACRPSHLRRGCRARPAAPWLAAPHVLCAGPFPRLDPPRPRRQLARPRPCGPAMCSLCVASVRMTPTVLELPCRYGISRATLLPGPQARASRTGRPRGRDPALHGRLRRVRGDFGGDRRRAHPQGQARCRPTWACGPARRHARRR